MNHWPEPQRQDRHREGGFALVLAVSSLALLGFVSLSALTLARSEAAAGLAALARVQARGAAEAALADALLGWPDASTPVAVGSEVLLTQTSVPGPASGQARLRSLGGSVYALRALGERRSLSGRLLASVRLELLVLPGAPDSNFIIHPVVYPRGWRVLP